MSRILKIVFILLLSLVLISCSLLSSGEQTKDNSDESTTEVDTVNEAQVDTSDGSADDSSNSSVPEMLETDGSEPPFVPETSGAQNFAATLIAPDVVQFTWEPEADVAGYELRMKSIDNLYSYRIASLPAGSNEYVDYLAPENTTIIYELVSLTAKGEGGTSSLQIQTQPRKPNPFSVQTTFMEEMAVSALIGLEGGQLSLTDSNGVNYSLEIPANAILLETEVAMTPVVNIENWPLDGNVLAGVHIEPDGWLLYEPAMLTITLPEESNSGLAQVGFGFNESGDEFHLAPIYPDAMSVSNHFGNATYYIKANSQQNGRVIRLPVMELKGSGVGESSAQTAGDLVKNNPPSNSSNANDQKAAAANAEDDLELAPLLSPQELASRVPYNMYNQIFAIKDCYDFKKAVAAYQAWDSSASTQQKTNWSQDLLENLGKKAVEVSRAAAKECVNAEEGVVPSSVPCAEKLIRDIQSASTPFYQQLQNTMKSSAGLLGELLTPQKDLGKCPHSFKVNDAAQLGTQWLSGCIPSLDRPFQVKFKNPSGTFQYRLYPSGPFSGKVEGDGGQEMEGATMSFVYSGTYTVDVLSRDINGNIEELDILTSMKRTTIICASGTCFSQEDEAENAERIPIMVNPTRCELP